MSIISLPGEVQYLWNEQLGKHSSTYKSRKTAHHFQGITDTKLKPLQHHLLSAWIMFKAARGTNMLIDPSASQTTRALERKKGWIWREHSKVLWEFIKVLYLQNLQALYSNWRCLTTHPSCLKHNTQQILPKENTQWNSLTVTFGFWLRIVQ